MASARKVLGFQKLADKAEEERRNKGEGSQ